MNPRGFSLLACSSLLGAATLMLALLPRSAPAAVKARASAVASAKLERVVAASSSGDPSRERPKELVAFASLPAVQVVNQTTRETLEVRLYDRYGAIDEAAARQLDELLCDARDPKHHHSTRLNRRTLQLLFKAAYHFNAPVEVVSAYRMPGKRREGPHGNGSAIDFRLRDVKAAELASYLRNIPRTGVGVYTHPKTQYVHIDAREQSFHWLDASPPRRHWRERSIGSKDMLKRDALYTPSLDLPESALAP